jgi:hypothetical protein
MTDERRGECVGLVQAGDTLLFVHPLPCTQILSSTFSYARSIYLPCLAHIDTACRPPSKHD